MNTNSQKNYHREALPYYVLIALLMGITFFFYLTALIPQLMRPKPETVTLADIQKQDPFQKPTVHTQFVLFLEHIVKALEQEGIEASYDSKDLTLRITDKEMIFPKGMAHFPQEVPVKMNKLISILDLAISCHTDLNKDVLAEQKFSSAIKNNQKNHCQQTLPPEPLYLCPDNVEKLQLNSVFIEGHADNYAITKKYHHYRDNLDLTYSRARFILNYTLHCSSSSLAAFINNKNQPLFSLVSHGEFRLLIENLPLSETNRRIEFRFIPDWEQELDLSH